MPNIAQKAVRVRAGNGDIYNAKAVFVQCNWTGTDGPVVNLALNPQQNAGISIDHVESVFIDNTKCSVPVTISSVNPPQMVTIVPGAVVNLHLDVAGLDNPLTLATVGQANAFGVTTFIFRDYPTNASSTLITGAASAATVTETDLAAAAQNDPADNHPSIRVQDLRSFNVLSAMSAALAGTLGTRDAVLDGIVSNGKLAVSDAATVQLAALIASGKLAVSDSVLEALVSNGKLAVSDSVLEALVSGGKLAISDALVEAAILGAGATSRLAAQLVDTSSVAFGTAANPLFVSERPSNALPRVGGVRQLAVTANNGGAQPYSQSPVSLIGLSLNCTATATSCLNIYDTLIAPAFGSTTALKAQVIIPANSVLNYSFPAPLGLVYGVVWSLSTGPDIGTQVTTGTISGSFVCA